jgi:hypothetical protein
VASEGNPHVHLSKAETVASNKRWAKIADDADMTEKLWTRHFGFCWRDINVGDPRWWQLEFYNIFMDPPDAVLIRAMKKNGVY